MSANSSAGSNWETTAKDGKLAGEELLIDLSCSDSPYSEQTSVATNMSGRNASTDLLNSIGASRYNLLPRPLLDNTTDDPFHVGEHIKSYAGYQSKSGIEKRTAYACFGHSLSSPHFNNNSNASPDYPDPRLTDRLASLMVHSNEKSLHSFDHINNGNYSSKSVQQVAYDQVPNSYEYSSTSNTVFKTDQSHLPAESGNRELSAPPPLPPRHKDMTADQILEKQKNLIRPIIEAGKVVSHTHYFLLAPKPDSQSKSPPLAAIKPFDPRADHSKIHHSGKSTFFVGHENKVNPDYVNQDEIENAEVNPPLVAMPRACNVVNKTPEVPVALLVNTSTANEKTVTSLSPRAQVEQVNSQVPGTNEEEAYAALQNHKWDTHRAVQYLKIEQLFRLGLTTREKCREELNKVNWSLELAASNLIDKCHLGIPV